MTDKTHPHQLPAVCDWLSELLDRAAAAMPDKPAPKPKTDKNK